MPVQPARRIAISRIRAFNLTTMTVLAFAVAILVSAGGSRPVASATPAASSPTLSPHALTASLNSSPALPASARVERVDARSFQVRATIAAHTRGDVTMATPADSAPANPNAATQSTDGGNSASSAGSNGYGCAAALAYLRANAAPGFTFLCPGYAAGRQAMTCINHPPECSAGSKVIAISVPCPAAYKNEASNSWVLTGRSSARIDPYGSC